MTAVDSRAEHGTPSASATDEADEMSGRNLAMLRAEVALTAVTATLAITFARLFRSGDFLPKLVLVVVVAHALAAIARRQRLPLWVSIPLLALVAGLLFSWLYLTSSLHAGLPSGQTITQARTALDGAFSPFRRLVPPVPITIGFEITMAIGLWVLAVFADAAAFSGEAPVQALVPHAAAFLGSSVFARGRWDVASATALAAVTLVFFAAHRAQRASKRHWVQLEQRRGSTALFAAGAGLALVAVLVSAVIAPHLPGVGDKPVVDLRTLGKGPGPIEVGNPLVGVGNMLAAQSDDLFFTVKATAPHYWRLTSLEDYDSSHQQWKTKRSYRDADSGQTLSGSPAGPSTNETDHVTLSGLPGIWLPTAYQPREIVSDIDFRYDPGSASVIAAARSALPKTSYDVTAAIPSDAIAPSTRADTNVDAVYKQVPKVSNYVRQVLATVTGSANGDVAKLRALQTFFQQTFRYSTQVNYSVDADPTTAFLKNGVGFCQQFSSTFAVMARLLGIPSRVAVGFTYGVPGSTTDSKGRKTYSVRGRQAHAWPEVHLTGVGWVAFEPTPGRGNPDDTTLTGLTQNQDSGSAITQPPTATTTTLAGSTPPTSTPNTGRIHLNDGDRSSTSKKHTAAAGHTGRTIILVVLIFAALLAIAVIGRAGSVIARRRRRRGRGTSPGSRVRAAWIDTCDWLELLAVRPVRSETPTEFTRRVHHTVPVDALAELAQLETERLFSDQPLDETAAATAEEVARQVRGVVIDRTDRRQRVAHLMGWERRN